jgi:hypothetical protein
MSATSPTKKMNSTMAPGSNLLDATMPMKKHNSVNSPVKGGAHKPVEETGVTINPEGVVNIDFK